MKEFFCFETTKAECMGQSPQKTLLGLKLFFDKNKGKYKLGRKRAVVQAISIDTSDRNLGEKNLQVHQQKRYR